MLEKTTVLMENPKFRGNCKRIKELYELGQRPDAIAQEFRNNGINISVNMVNVVLNDELPELKRKALLKVVVEEKRRNII